MQPDALHYLPPALFILIGFWGWLKMNRRKSLWSVAVGVFGIAVFLFTDYGLNLLYTFPLSVDMFFFLSQSMLIALAVTGSMQAYWEFKR